MGSSVSVSPPHLELLVPKNSRKEDTEIYNHNLNRLFLSENDKMNKYKDKMSANFFSNDLSLSDTSPSGYILNENTINSSNNLTLNYKPESSQNKKVNQNLIIMILSTFELNFIWYCQFLCSLIKNQMGCKKKLQLYVELFKEYVLSLQSISLDLQPLSTAINESYEFNFEFYPKFPKFSFWRMGMKIWVKEVSENISDSLNKIALKEILKLQRKNLAEILLTRNRPTSSIYIIEEAKKEFEILSEYVNAVIDISLNEISIYSSCHQLVELENPYKVFEEMFLDQTKTFYKKNFNLFKGCPKLLQTFFERELCLVSKLMLNRTYQNYCQEVTTSVCSQLEQIFLDFEMKLCNASNWTSSNSICQLDTMNEIIQIKDILLSRNNKYNISFKGNFEELICQRNESTESLDEEKHKNAEKLWELFEDKLKPLLLNYSYLVNS